MTRKPENGYVVDSYNIYSLDRCVKCLCNLKLGRNAFFSVNLRRAEPEREEK